MNSSGPSAVHCIDDETLRAFSSGRLVDFATEDRVAEHLSACDTCVSKLESIDDRDDPVIWLLRQPSPDTVEPSRSWLPDSRSDDRAESSTHSLGDANAGPAETDSLSVRSARDESLPMRIDRYFIIRRLGSGGYGQVYLAKDPERDQLVAIKIPQPFRAKSRRGRDEFLREARTAAALDHPHIVPVYDCRELFDGRCIIVMKFIEGQTLYQRMKEGLVDRKDAVRIIASVADALDYAHRRGVLHRDVKPGNILLDREGNAYLADFGLAADEAELARQIGSVAGTFAYMSPEQIRGETSQLDGRSDIWSLGVVFYELLTRRRPFVGASREQISNEVHSSEPDRPSVHAAGIPAHLERACLRCLRKEPAHRTSTAGELADSLRPRRRSSTKLRWIAAAIMLVLLVGIAGAASMGPWSPVGSNGIGERDPGGGEGGSVSGFADADKADGSLIQSIVSNRPADHLKPLAWGTIEKSDFYELDQASGRISVKSSASIGCWETHQTTREHYRIETSADCQWPSGIIGIAVGVHTTSTRPLKRRCLSIWVGKDFPDRGIRISCEDAEIKLNDLRHMDFGDRFALSRDVHFPHQSSNNVRLAVEVDRERVIDVQFNGKSIPELTKALADYRVPKSSGCGIIAMSHIVFQSVSLTEFP